MTMDTSGMNDKEKLYFENLKDQILARQVGFDPRNMQMSCCNLILVANYFRVGVWHMQMPFCFDLILVVAYFKRRFGTCR